MIVSTAAIVVGVWIVFAAIAGPRIGRAIRDAEPSECPHARSYTDMTLWQPDVPALRTVSDEDWWAEQPEMLPDDAPPPLVLPDDWTPAELEKAVTWHEFVDLMWAEFPQYRRDFTGGAA